MEVEKDLVLIISLVLLSIIFVLYYLYNRKANKKIEEFDSISEAIAVTKYDLESMRQEIESGKEMRDSIDLKIKKGIKENAELENETEALSESNRRLKEKYEELLDSKEKLDKSNYSLVMLKKDLDLETKSLQALKNNADNMALQFDESYKKNELLKADLEDLNSGIEIRTAELSSLIAKLDLYTRIDEFVGFGLFEEPDYLYETSLRFSDEIKEVRQKQKELIKGRVAVVFPDSIEITSENSLDKKILDGQIKLLLAAFNIECDTLIGKVSPGNFSRTLERIEKLANTLERSVATLHCGFNIEYIDLKFRECKLQYQYSLKKRDEQAEQRLIREQIREEQRAIKEYEQAIVQAEKEERMYRDMLEKAREELSEVSEEDRSKAEQRILELERQLEESEAKEERAKSMAEQTRKGHVYVISNVGSFGDQVYKIGLTRRLEPMDRVKELGDASVPFPFDVHAMIYVDDAPALEAALHREFSRYRVNAVNLRKEFFNTDLHSIKKAVERISGDEAEFKMTALAADYYESRRLIGLESSVA